MQITRQTEYAIRTLLELASQPYGEVLSARAISRQQEIPEEFLKKTIQMLSSAGLVITQRGVQGGVKLARPADQITIADIVVAIEGPFAINPCLAPDYICKNRSTCPVNSVLARAQKALVNELSKETLIDLLNNSVR
ncbi:MAG: RrF2 family transcriptional regulator [Syntrophomonadaceae bacterium]|jgi:Rrf2 family protein